MPFLNPAEYVIHKIGGVRKTARAINLRPGTVSKWRKGDGMIPGDSARKILKFAEKQKPRLDINAHDLLIGRAIPKA